MLKLGKEIDFHYAHVRTVLKEFQDENIIKPIFNTEKANHDYDPGKPYKVELTTKGKLLNKVLQMFLMIKEGVQTKQLIKIVQKMKVQNGK